MKRSGCPRYCVREQVAAPRFVAAVAVVVVLSIYLWAGLAYEGADLSELAADR